MVVKILTGIVHGEADFDGHLPPKRLSVFDVPARIDHLKPAQMLDGFTGPFNGLSDGILDRRGGCASEFD